MRRKAPRDKRATKSPRTHRRAGRQRGGRPAFVDAVTEPPASDRVFRSEAEAMRAIEREAGFATSGITTPAVPMSKRPRPTTATANASYQRHMTDCARLWQATGDPAAIIEATNWMFMYRQPPPRWFGAAVWALVKRRRTKAHDKRAHEAAVRLDRYNAVHDAKASGLTWDQAYARAAETLAGTSAAGDADRMKKSFIAVKRDLKTGRGGRY